MPNPEATDQLEALALRCEQATAEQQYEIILDAWVAVHGAETNWHPFIDILALRAYESAALTLVPEGLPFELTRTSDGRPDEAFVWSGKAMGHGYSAEAATPALALCAAALRASKDTSHGR